ncbi:hypothetical protein SLEP1_g14865 [Rubroshorea leprosula]|uniref:Uncharacterized protein n=1 Tax=Rubroshorea leprosula TaxID=152421 RepID=A0AAV5IVZ7_9ROSI|nr:hypothetical protein SLEP1_g14865 [Rubroshorea leprosula]
MTSPENIWTSHGMLIVSHIKLTLWFEMCYWRKQSYCTSDGGDRREEFLRKSLLPSPSWYIAVLFIMFFKTINMRAENQLLPLDQLNLQAEIYLLTMTL